MKDCRSVVKNGRSEKDKKADVKARNYIVASLSNSQLDIVSNEEKAKRYDWKTRFNLWAEK